MRREKFLCLSLSRFARASAVVLITLVLAGAARADNIKEFVVKGTALNSSDMELGGCDPGETCSFSGTLTVDMTANRVSSWDITFPGFRALANHFRFDGSIFPPDLWLTQTGIGSGSTGFFLSLAFTTGRTPSSLVGFDGGSITPSGFNFLSALSSTGDGTSPTFYTDFRGSITPTAAIPEPGTLGMLVTGLIGLGGMARRKLKR